MMSGALRDRLREDAAARGVRWGLRPVDTPVDTPVDVPAQWRLNALLGRLVEVTGGRASAALAVVFGLVREAQSRGEPVAWIANTASAFYPPDVAAAGVDLAALAVVRIPGVDRDADVAPRVADPLVRSGGFGLVVMDLADPSRGRSEPVRLPTAVQSRLSGLAKRHCAAIVCVTAPTGRSASLGPLISLRVEASRDVERSRDADECTSDEVACEIHARKDKRRGGGWRQRSVYRVPPGLC